jgi:hypothetical protein
MWRPLFYLVAEMVGLFLTILAHFFLDNEWDWDKLK